MTTPTPLAALFGLALTAAVVALLVGVGGWLLADSAHVRLGLAAAAPVPVGGFLLWLREKRR